MATVQVVVLGIHALMVPSLLGMLDNELAGRRRTMLNNMQCSEASDIYRPRRMDIEK